MKIKIFEWALWGVYFYRECVPAVEQSQYNVLFNDMLRYMRKHHYNANWSISQKCFIVKKMTPHEVECYRNAQDYSY